MYDQFYGFNARPFQLTPDPQFYFESGTHRKALSYLGYGLAQGEGFIVITGEVGSGKSTLVGHLMQTIDKQRLSAATIVTSQLDGHDLVHMVAESFGISSQAMDKPATLKAIEEHLHAEARAGRRCLLIVDEAQNLSVDALEELRMLSNFQLGSEALLQIFLLGQPEFRDLVHTAPELEQLRQRVIATHHLEAMDEDEVEPYIVHRLTRVGWDGRPKITEDAYRALSEETGGVPRKLNTLMNRVLLMGSVEQLKVIEDDLIFAVIADMEGKPFEYTAPDSAKAQMPDAPFEEAAAPEAADMESDVEDASTEDAPQADEETPAAPMLAMAGIPTADEAFEEDELDEAVLPAAEQAMVAAALESAASEASSETVDTQAYLDAAAEDVTDNVVTAPIISEADRITALETKVAEQDAAIRRLLAMMIDWMDKEQDVLSRELDKARAA